VGGSKIVQASILRPVRDRGLNYFSVLGEITNKINLLIEFLIPPFIEGSMHGSMNIKFIFLFLHHQSKSLENIFLFYLAQFNSVARKVFLSRNNIGGELAPPSQPRTPQIAPMILACDQLGEKGHAANLSYFIELPSAFSGE
jgi:hypothetical protein